jgi:hypothetical protein
LRRGCGSHQGCVLRVFFVRRERVVVFMVSR